MSRQICLLDVFETGLGTRLSLSPTARSNLPATKRVSQGHVPPFMIRNRSHFPLFVMLGKSPGGFSKAPVKEERGDQRRGDQIKSSDFGFERR